MQAPAAVNSHGMALYSKQVRCITVMAITFHSGVAIT